jgi:biopolymer transport protein ExbD
MSFGSFSEGGTPQPMGEINTTPLVDVMLVLLVIFIITIPAMHQAVPIDLPQVSSQKVEDTPVVIQLALDADGRYFLDGAPAHRADLESHFRRHRRAQSRAASARRPRHALRERRGHPRRRAEGRHQSHRLRHRRQEIALARWQEPASKTQHWSFNS